MAWRRGLSVVSKNEREHGFDKANVPGWASNAFGSGFFLLATTRWTCCLPFRVFLFCAMHCVLVFSSSLAPGWCAE